VLVAPVEPRPELDDDWPALDDDWPEMPELWPEAPIEEEPLEELEPGAVEEPL
jgi:hypothetical protein